MAASLLPSRGPKRGRKCDITPAFRGSPTKGEQNQKWLSHPYLLGGPKEGGNATSPRHSRGSPTKGNKITSGCLNPAFSGAEKRVEMLHLPSILGGPQRQARGAKTEVQPQKGKQNQKWVPHPCLLGGRKEGENATSPLHSRGSPTPRAGSKIRSAPQQRGTKSEVAASPLPSWGPKRGRKCYITPPFSGVPNAKRGEQNKNCTPTKGNKIRSACLTPAFSGAQKRVKMLHHPSILGRPQRQGRGAKTEVHPQKREQNEIWLPHPCLLGGPKEGENATSPLHSRASPTPRAGSKIGSAPPKKGNKIRSGCLTPAFSGAQRRAKMLHLPSILGGPQRQAWGPKSEVHPNKGEQNQKCLPHPCLLGGPKEGGNATSPLHSRASPTPSVGSKIRSAPPKRGSKSEVAASPLPSRGPKRGRKCSITPPLSWVPNAKRGEKWPFGFWGTVALTLRKKFAYFLSVTGVTRVALAWHSENKYSYMGVFTGGGGGHSDAKWEIFQFSPFFSKMSFRRGGGGCYTFLKSPRNGRFGKVWVRGGDRWQYIFLPDPTFLAFWYLLQKFGLVWFGLYTRFHGAWPGAPTCRR